MKSVSLSSGDLVADRRVAFAQMLLAQGDAPAAAEVLSQTLELVPQWAAGWYWLGEMHEAAGAKAAAGEAWREALRLDPADRLGAALKLELAGLLEPASTVTTGFAEALFDQYADRFDSSLVEKLGYVVPELLAEAIVRAGGTAFAHVLDLGCGTGLMGERLRTMASFVEGVDISAGMLAKARAKGIYDRLSRHDLLTLPADGFAGTDRIDLVTAADVFIYLGRLEQIAATVATLLAPGGMFAFTVEHHHGPEDVMLRPSRRYAHSPAYLRAVLAGAGFEMVSFETAPIRQDRGEPIEGVVVVARRLEATDPVVLTRADTDEERAALH